MYPLGRRVHHDPRSLAFRAATSEVHRPVLHRIYGPKLNQGDLGSCVLNAAAHALNAAPIHRPHQRLVYEPQAVAWYTEATAIDPFPGQMPDDDTGTDANSAAKVLRAHGRITGWHHAFGLDHFLAALQLSPIMLGITWDYSMFEVDAKGFVHPDGNAAGGHETLVFADDAQGTVEVRNNWWEHGKPWGLHGNYRLSYADLKAKLADQGDATVLTRQEPT
jgi:hypothetical protein